MLVVCKANLEARNLCLWPDLEHVVADQLLRNWKLGCGTTCARRWFKFQPNAWPHPPPGPPRPKIYGAKTTQGGHDPKKNDVGTGTCQNVGELKGLPLNSYIVRPSLLHAVLQDVVNERVFARNLPHLLTESRGTEKLKL